MKLWLVLPALVILAGFGWWRLNPAPPSQAASSSEVTAAANPDDIQIDNQGIGKVLAQYLPNESTSSQAVVTLTLTGTPAEILGYDYAVNIVWADADIDPLPTVRTELVSRSEFSLSVKMTFQRDRRSHYHLIVKEFGGIHNRVLHFYSLPR